MTNRPAKRLTAAIAGVSALALVVLTLGIRGANAAEGQMAGARTVTGIGAAGVIAVVFAALEHAVARAVTGTVVAAVAIDSATSA